MTSAARRLAIFSANYNGPDGIDSYRKALLLYFQSQGLEVSFFCATDFVTDISEEERFRGGSALLLEGLKRFAPHAVLFLNACGRIRPVQAYLEEQKVPSATWFWDHPAIHVPELIQPGQHHRYLSANTTFQKWIEARMKTACEFVAFPCMRLENFTPASTRDIPILFMASMWDLLPFVDHVQHFLDNPKQKDIRIPLPELLKLIREDIVSRNEGGPGLQQHEPSRKKLFVELRKTYLNEANYLMMANNYFAACERFESVRALAPEGLHLFGPQNGWSRLIESYGPELKQAFRYKNVTDPHELMRICSSARIGLNVFHHQNQGGGTNFRFNEYASVLTPILSNRNAECERIFPQNEAVFYFDKAADLPGLAQNLLASPDLLEKAARNAHRIAVDNFGIERIGKQLLEKLDLGVVASQSGSVAMVERDKTASISWRHNAETVGYRVRQYGLGGIALRLLGRFLTAFGWRLIHLNNRLMSVRNERKKLSVQSLYFP